MRNLFLALFLLTSCTTVPTGPSQAPSTGNCAVVSETLKLANQTLTLPATGKVVLESHLATGDDSFPGGRIFPNTTNEGISAHIARACKIGGFADCSKVYASKYVNEWTPQEGGLFGQGSVGNLKPSASEEMWSGNMFWTAANKPKPGTRFLATRAGKAVVAVMGYETGPSDPSYIAGLQGEVISYLGGQDNITIGRSVDQSLVPGPVVCK